MRTFTLACVCSCFYLLIFYTGAVAQQKVKRVYIISKTSQQPVPEVLVESEDKVFTSLTDQKGFTSIPANVHSITVSCIGFKTTKVDVSFPDSLGRVIIFLENKIASLAEITVASTTSNVLKTLSDLDIHLRPTNNSQEILRLVPGLFIGQHAGGGKAEQIFLRGFDIDHGTDINLSVDGMPVNMVSHAHGQGYADLHFVIPELVDKVNFNKGPYFADKGNFTTAGFVEYKTKDHLEKNFFKSEAGQFNTYRMVGGINFFEKSKSGFKRNVYLAGEGFYSDGFFTSPQDFNRFNATLKYHGELGTKSLITTTLTGFKSRWNASGQIPVRAVLKGLINHFGAIDNNEGGWTSRYNINFQLNTLLGKDTRLMNQFYFSKYRFELYSNFTFFKEDSINGDQIRQKENREIFGYNGSLQKNYRIGRIRSQLKTGLQLRYDKVNDVELTRTRNRIENTREINLGDVDELNTALHVSQSVSLSSKWEITTSLRADYFSNTYEDDKKNLRLQSQAAIISPKLKFDFRPQSNIHLYLYTGRGFHSNDTRVVVQQPGRKTVPPAYGADLGGIFKWGKNLVLQSSLWYLWLDQEFIYVGDEGVVEPGGETARYGIDFSARIEVSRNLFADVDLSLANPRAIKVPKEESYLPLAPRFTSAGGLVYKNTKGLNGSLRYRFMGNRPANENYSTIAKGYFIMDAAAFFTAKKWEAGVTVQNIFNVKWKETQFETDSRLQNETSSVSEIHFTPGTPLFAKASFTFFF